ncbi:50S ribosomal protein L29 [Patescibacteria group bacterium]|nr:50S ribosomal protein L29 [Patescibacteria group bacterium]
MAKAAQLIASELTGKSFKDLVALRNDLRKELFGLQMKNHAKALKETHQIRNVRRNIARVNTVLSSKSLVK